MAGRAWLKQPHTAPKAPSNITHMTKGDTAGSPWLESPQWRWLQRTGKEPATKGLAEGAVLEGSFLACPLPLLSVDPDPNGNPKPSTMGAPGEGPALLLQGRHGRVTPKPSEQAQRDSTFQTNKKKAGKPSESISAVTDHNLPKTFQGTFSIHSQSHRGRCCYCLSHSSVRKPTSRGLDIFLPPAAESPGSPTGGDRGDGGRRGELRDDTSPTSEAGKGFITGGQNYSGNHRGSNWKLLDRETSPFSFQMCRPVSLH